MSAFLLSLLPFLPRIAGQFNNPAGVDIWCGKAYRATNASFNPGGFFDWPTYSDVPLLNLNVAPRMTIYLDDEDTGTFLVNASVSHLVGTPYPNSKSSKPGHDSDELEIGIYLEHDTAKPLTQKTTSITIGTVAEIPFDLSSLVSRTDPYNVTAIATANGVSFTATTQVTKLPVRTDNGTAVRIDNLYGGLGVRRGKAKEWKPIFPYTYYVQWSLYWDSNISTLNEFADMGYNVIHIVPTGNLSDTPFPWDQFNPYVQKAAELGLYFQYDVIWDYSNLTGMISQIEHLKDDPSILLWYTGDEPDGKSDPLNSTRIAYDTIKAMDPYHPISLALNCFNFYYTDYANGADIILSDVYPISTNTSWSTEYLTPCNATYGCCGCDDCHGHFEDISDRLDNFAQYDEIVGWPKHHWGAPQAFGNETFWTRYPTAAEEVVMNMLSINHGAKGVVMWDFPTTEEILTVTNALAAVLTQETVASFFIGAPRTGSLAVSGGERIDATAWVTTTQVMLSVINLNYGDVSGEIAVTLPDGIQASLESTLWGDTAWSVEGSKLRVNGLKGLETSLLILDISK